MKRIRAFLFAIVAAGLTLSGCQGAATTAPKSGDAKLTALAVSVGTLTPAFSADVTDYTVSLFNIEKSITVTGTKSSDKASVSANSGVAQTLSVGENAIAINVTAEDGTAKTYTVKVTRLDAPAIYGVWLMDGGSKWTFSEDQAVFYGMKAKLVKFDNTARKAVYSAVTGTTTAYVKFSWNAELNQLTYSPANDADAAWASTTAAYTSTTMKLANENPHAPYELAYVGGSLQNGGTTVNIPVKALDIDTGDTVTYALVDGAGDNAAFAIAPISDGAALTAKTAADFAAKKAYALTIKATDSRGYSSTHAYTVYVANSLPATGSFPLGGSWKSNLGTSSTIKITTGSIDIATQSNGTFGGVILNLDYAKKEAVYVVTYHPNQNFAGCYCKLYWSTTDNTKYDIRQTGINQDKKLSYDEALAIPGTSLGVTGGVTCTSYTLAP